MSLPLTGAGPSAGYSYSGKVLSYSPIAYWQLNEAAGGDAFDSSGNSFDGTYTNCTLGQTGIGDGETAPLFDNDDCYVNVYSTGFRDAYNKTELTIATWAKVFNVGVWGDASNNTALSFCADLNANMSIIKLDSSFSGLRHTHEAGNVPKEVQDTGHSETGWFHLAFEVSKTGDTFKAYFNGSQVGSTQSSLGVWSGNLHANYTLIGCLSTAPLQPWYGWMAHTAVFDNAIGGAAIADLATV